MLCQSLLVIKAHNMKSTCVSAFGPRFIDDEERVKFTQEFPGIFIFGVTDFESIKTVISRNIVLTLTIKGD